MVLRIQFELVTHYELTGELIEWGFTEVEIVEAKERMEKLDVITNM
jgi:hypothetical protein